MDAGNIGETTWLDKAGRIALCAFVFAIVAIAATVFIKPKKGSPDRSDILEKAREAKAAKRILNQSENENLPNDGKEKADTEHEEL